jgi:hypothetical protein
LVAFIFGCLSFSLRREQRNRRVILIYCTLRPLIACCKRNQSSP